MIPIFQFKGKPLELRESEIFIHLLMSKPEEKPCQEDSELMKEFIPKVISDRIDIYKIDLSISNVLMAMLDFCFIRGNPGKAMGCLWILYTYSKKSGKKSLSLEDFADIFPDGCPSQHEFEEWWDSQKGGKDTEYDNAVDMASFWK